MTNINGLESVIENIGGFLARADSGQDKVLLPRQLQTMHKIHSFLESGYTQGHIILPTGIGKTVIFSKFLEAVSKDKDTKGLVVGPTKIILHQNRWKLGEFGEIESGAYFGNEKDLSKQITVTTYRSLQNGIENGDIKPNEFDFLILDEAHRALGEQSIKTINSFSDKTIKLGFTATPEFHDEKSVADILPITIDELSLFEGIRANLLSGLKVYLADTERDFSNISRKGKEYDLNNLEIAINTPSRNQLIAKLYKDNPLFNGKRGVVYCNGRQHAKDMASTFSSAGIPTGYVDGETKFDEREKMFRDFKQGDLQILCNAEVLIEGFDEPEAEVCINAVPTLSRIVAEQRGGRVLRRSKIRNDKIGYVIEIVDDFKDSENTPVLFSEIVGAAEVIPEDMEIKRNNTISPSTHKKALPIELNSRLIESPEVIMEITNKNKKQRYTKLFEYAPEGWVHPRQLAHECNVKENDVRNFAEGQREDKPDYFKRYLTSTELLVTHYHPDIVNNVRRRFVKSLEGKITSKDYSEEFIVDEKKAEHLLSSVQGKIKVKPLKFGVTSYYSKSESLAILANEEKQNREFQKREIEIAEEDFWADDDLSDFEKERNYWDNFDRLFTEDENLVEEDSNLVSFVDDLHIPFVQDEPSILRISDSKRKELREIVKSVCGEEAKLIEMRFFEDKNLREMSTMINDTRGSNNMAYLINKNLRKLIRLSRQVPLSRISEIYDPEDRAEEEVSRIIRNKKQSALYDIPVKELVRRFNLMEKNLILEEDGEMHIASWKKPHYEKYKALVYSMLPSDKDNLYSRDSVLRKNSERILSMISSRAILTEDDIKIGLSPDKKMIELYDLDKLSDVVRRYNEAVIAEKSSINVAQYVISQIIEDGYDKEYTKECRNTGISEKNFVQNKAKEIADYFNKYCNSFYPDPKTTTYWRQFSVLK